MADLVKFSATGKKMWGYIECGQNEKRVDCLIF